MPSWNSRKGALGKEDDLLDLLSEGYFLINDKLHIVAASKAFEALVGDVKRTSLLDILDESDIKIFRKFWATWPNNKKRSIQLRLKNGKHSSAWYDLVLSERTPPRKEVLIAVKDLSREKDLLSRAEFLETINRNLAEGIFMGVLGGKLLYVNEAFLQMTGYNSFAEISKLDPSVFFANESKRKALLRDLKRALSVKYVEMEFRKKNKQTFWGIVNLSLFKHDGEENYFVGTITDITKQKQAEEGEKRSREFLESIINAVNAPFYIKNQKNKWIIFNKRFKEVLGCKGEVPDTFSLAEIIKPNEASVWEKADRKVLKSGIADSSDHQVTNRLGEVYHFITIRSRYEDEFGNRYVFGSMTDVTSFKQAEVKIQQLYSDLQAILESSNESIFSLDSSYCYTSYNTRHKERMKKLYNAHIEIGGNKLSYLQGHEDRKWLKSELERAMGGQQFVSQHRQQMKSFDGYIQVTYNPILDGKAVKGVAVFIRDVTDRIRTEEIIKSTNANLRAVLESTNDRIVAISKDFTYLMFNQAHAASINKLFGKQIKVGDNLLDVLPPPLAKIAEVENRKAFKGKQFTITTQINDELTLETSYNPIYNDKGIVEGNALFIRDISAQKKLEQRMLRLNEELMKQNERLAAREEELKGALKELSERNFELDQLIYKTSHDLRSPLSSIMGLISLAYIEDPQNHFDYLQKIEGRIKKLDDFITSMLSYARVNRGDLEIEKVDVNEVVRTCINELEYLDSFNKIKTEITVKNKPAFYSNRLRVEIIASNITSNAFKYYNPKTESFLKIDIEYLDTGAVKIIFVDNGIGIRAEHLDKIFNMFYRATERSQGSGLGMYIVKQAVDKINGDIHIESEYGSGTKIFIYLPSLKKKKQR